MKDAENLNVFIVLIYLLTPIFCYNTLHSKEKKMKSVS